MATLELTPPDSSEQKSKGHSPIFQAEIVTPRNASMWRKFFLVAGPGIMISVGYMDPGNWGTDIQAGAAHGYALLWVVLLSSLIAAFLQSLCARLGLGGGVDLATTSRVKYGPKAGGMLWATAQIAVVACDLAEVIGSAVALNLLFHWPLVLGAAFTAVDVLILLGLTKMGFRKLEAVVAALVATIAVCFLIQGAMSTLAWKPIMVGALFPTLPGSDSLLIAVGILGATVMPHNLYLHSALVGTRKGLGKREAIRFNTWDTWLSLGAAFFVNAAILVVASAAFHNSGHQDVQDLGKAYSLLGPLLGKAAPIAFAVGLLASGQSSTITGTLAGQVVAHGFLNITWPSWIMRLATRLSAVVPAIVIISISGANGTMSMLILSQVVLSLQLPFAIFPLLAAVTDKKTMGEWTVKPSTAVLGYACGFAILILNLWLLYATLQLWAFGLCLVGVAAFAFILRAGKKATEINRQKIAA